MAATAASMLCHCIVFPGFPKKQDSASLCPNQQLALSADDYCGYHRAATYPSGLLAARVHFRATQFCLRPTKKSLSHVSP